MFGKLTAEQKEAMRARFANTLASDQAPGEQQPPLPAGDHATDNESAEESDTEGGPVRQNTDETNSHAAETLRIYAKAETVEIANIRLFSIDELNLNSLTECRSLSLRKNLIHELLPFPTHLANRLTEIDFFDNKIRKIGNFFHETREAEEKEKEEGCAADEEAENGGGSQVVVGIVKVLPHPYCALTKLDLSYNQIKKIAGLDSLAPTLKELYLVENKIKIIQGLDALVNLELLELGGNRIREIGNGLRALTSLKQLWIGKNKIVNIGTSLNELHAVELISLQANRLVKIAPENFPAGANTHLRELYLSENGLDRIENLPAARAVTLLDYSFNPIAHINEAVISPANLPALEEFWLTDGKVDAWDEVETFKPFAQTLRTVYLERNPIEQDKRYRDKVYRCLPFVTQIDSWPVVNKDDLESDRSIQRRNPRE